MSTTSDRIEELRNQSPSVLTGIDFVYVHPEYVLSTDADYLHPNQIRVDVYFHEPAPSTLTAPLTDPSGSGGLDIDQVTIYSAFGGSVLNEIEITGMTWVGEILRLDTRFSNDYALFKIFIDDPARVDRYYNNITFRFNANCPTDLDCKPLEPECPPEESVDFPVNYLARDFWSYRKALLDFATLRYPDWKDRLEADAGVMLAELMSALGDDMAYYQDRVGREAYLATASQRRSIRSMTKLMDYRIHDGRGASTWIDIQVDTGGTINAGMDLSAISDNSRQIFFEVGRGLADVIEGQTYAVDPIRNEFDVHCWDEDDTCLPIGSTELFIKGHHETNIPLDDVGTHPDDPLGKWVLLITQPDPSLPVRAHMVRLIQVSDTNDPVLGDDLTHLVWEAEQATVYEMDMRVLKVRANMVPATSGKTYTQLFVVGQDVNTLAIPDDEKAKVDRAVEREGKDKSLTYLYSLPATENAHLIRLGDDLRATRPEIFMQEVEWDGAGVQWVATSPASPWKARPSFVGTYSSQPLSNDYVLEDGTWKRVVGYQRPGGEVVHKDYSSNNGVTIRFGDGEFGLIPIEGTIFQVDYRVGLERRDNVPVDSITHFTLSGTATIHSVNNPFPVVDAVDAESKEVIRQLAPEAYRAVTYRAVRPEDYSEAIERLDRIQTAGANFRWTGSWLSVFATPDPEGAVALAPDLEAAVTLQLDRFRQAGREAHVLKPKYADLDLYITVCVREDAYRGEVKIRILQALFGKNGNSPISGYFSPDRFTFGTPLDRSTLEDAIQSVPGVKAVEHIYFSRRGWFTLRRFVDMKYNPGVDTIIRIENNQLHPERGTITLKMEGGA